MSFSDNRLPLGPNGSFPRQRISTFGNMIIPPVNAEGVYFRSEVARLPTVEKDYDFVVRKAKRHMSFGKGRYALRRVNPSEIQANMRKKNIMMGSVIPVKKGVD